MADVEVARIEHIEQEQKDDGDVEMAVEPISIVIDSHLQRDNYTKTRHGNLRCFPQCNPVHNDRAFCGDSLLLHVEGTHYGRDVHVLGEFRPLNEESVLSVGRRVTQEIRFSRHFVEATLVGRDDAHNRIRFSFNPKRKWEYPLRSNGSELHVFSVYCVIDGRVVGVTNTTPFQLTPIWRTTSTNDMNGGNDGDEDRSQMDEIESPKSGTQQGKQAPQFQQSTIQIPNSNTSSRPMGRAAPGAERRPVFDPLGVRQQRPPQPQPHQQTIQPSSNISFATPFSPALVAPSSSASLTASAFPLYAIDQSASAQFLPMQPHVYGGSLNYIPSNSYMMQPNAQAFPPYVQPQPAQTFSPTFQQQFSSFSTPPVDKSAHFGSFPVPPMENSRNFLSNAFGYGAAVTMPAVQQPMASYQPFGPRQPWPVERQSMIPFGMLPPSNLDQQMAPNKRGRPTTGFQ